MADHEGSKESGGKQSLGGKLSASKGGKGGKVGAAGKGGKGTCFLWFCIQNIFLFVSS